MTTQTEIESIATNITKIPQSCKHLEEGLGDTGSVRGSPLGGATLRITCNDGYFLDGESDTFKCNGETGRYNPAAPTCTKCDKGCAACTAQGLSEDACQICDKAISYDRDEDTNKCKEQECVV